MFHNYKKENLHNARQLRRNMTKEERKLWYEFLRLQDAHFYKQRPIGSYIVDFYCPKKQLIIELDGSQHFEEAGLALDLVRDKFFEEQGIKVLRFSNSDINSNFDGVCTEILKHLNT